VVTIKYVLILLLADNNGEGGTLSLTALVFRAIGRRTPVVLLLGIIGAAMFLGDSVITPAISVLSAVEGLKLAIPASEHIVVPLTIVILIVLFAVQRRGTARVAAFFGPVMVIWFVVIAIAGLLHINDDPRVFAAINPYYAVSFLGPAWLYRAGDTGCGLSCRDRRRGAVCRPRTFRPQADQDGLVRLGAAGFDAELFRPGRDAAARSDRDSNPFYKMLPEMLLLRWWCWRPPRP
jgi:KUP system potassium uptake protein